MPYTDKCIAGHYSTIGGKCERISRKKHTPCHGHHLPQAILFRTLRQHTYRNGESVNGRRSAAQNSCEADASSECSAVVFFAVEREKKKDKTQIEVFSGTDSSQASLLKCDLQKHTEVIYESKQKSQG